MSGVDSFFVIISLHVYLYWCLSPCYCWNVFPCLCTQQMEQDLKQSKTVPLEFDPAIKLLEEWGYWACTSLQSRDNQHQDIHTPRSLVLSPISPLYFSSTFFSCFLFGIHCTSIMCVSRVARWWSKALHLSARGITTDPGSIPGCITTGRDRESHRVAHNWPSGVQVWPGQAVIVNKNLFLTAMPS